VESLLFLYKYLKKSLLFVVGLVFLLLSFACEDKHENYIKREEIVPITSFSILDSTAMGDTIEISATASVGNACWSNLRFYFTKENDTTYVLKAFGTFETHGSCPTEEISEDTVIDFSPLQTGVTSFYIIRNPYQYSIARLMVYDSLDTSG